MVSEGFDPRMVNPKILVVFLYSTLLYLFFGRHLWLLILIGDHDAPQKRNLEPKFRVPTTIGKLVANIRVTSFPSMRVNCKSKIRSSFKRNLRWVFIKWFDLIMVIFLEIHCNSRLSMRFVDEFKF